MTAEIIKKIYTTIRNHVDEGYTFSVFKQGNNIQHEAGITWTGDGQRLTEIVYSGPSKINTDEVYMVLALAQDMFSMGRIVERRENEEILNGKT